MPLPCRTSSPLQGSTRRNRAPLSRPLAPSSFGSAPRSSATRRALISLDFPRRPRPSDPPAPEAPSVTSCVLECGRPRRSGRSPSRARATFPPGPEPRLPRHPQARRCRAHPRVAPSTSERSSSRVPDSLPRRRHRLVGRGPRGVLPSRAFLRLRPRALTDLPGCVPQWGTGRALEMRYARGCAPRVGSAGPRCVLAWRPHHESTCRQRGRCVVRAGPPRGDRPLPPRPWARALALRRVLGVSQRLSSAHLAPTP